jgi:hypothetical protein
MWIAAPTAVALGLPARGPVDEDGGPVAVTAWLPRR